MAGMNTGLQKHTIKKKLKNRGIRPDKIDLEAEIDSTLTLPENIDRLEKKYGRLEREDRDYKARMEGARGRRQNYAKREAREIHERRSEYEQYVDETKDAETTYADPSERQFEKWRENPDQYDIEGVDTRKPAEERPQTKLPIQREKEEYLYQGTTGDIDKIHRSKPVDFREEVAKKMALEDRSRMFPVREADPSWRVEPGNLPEMEMAMKQEQGQKQAERGQAFEEKMKRSGNIKSEEFYESGSSELEEAF